MGYQVDSIVALNALRICVAVVRLENFSRVPVKSPG